MNKNKLILEHCPNFYKIINFKYFEDDYITEKLLKIYRKFIFSIEITNTEDVKKASSIDALLAKYVDDYIFRKEIKYGITKLKFKKDENIIKSVIDSLLNIFDNYLEGTTRSIYIARWI